MSVSSPRNLLFVPQTFVASALLLVASSCTSPKPAVTVAPPPPVQSVPKPSSSDTAWRLVAPKSGIPGRLKYPSPIVTRLENGVTLYVLERPLGPVALSAVVNRGAAGEPSEMSGLASLTAELMTEATQRRSHWALSEAAESLGSTLTGEANRDYLRLAIDTLPEDVGAGLALLAETLREPAFEEADFQRLRSQRLDELRAERQNPARLASLVALRNVLGAELGNPVSGCPTSVKKLRLVDLKTWHQRSVHPKTTALFVTGPVAAKDVEGYVQKLFGRWKTPKRPLPPLVEVPPLPRQRTVYLVDRPGSVQSALFVVESFPKRQMEGYIAREHLDNVLGGLFTSRINQNLREKHAYTYGARTSVIAAKHFGLFTCSTSVATEVTAPSLTEIFNELLAIRGNSAKSPIGAEELSRSTADLVQSLGAHLENNHRLLADLEQLYVYDLPNDYYAEYATQVPSVSLAEVAKETERFELERFVVVAVGDATRMKPDLEKAGFAVANASNECLTD